MTPVDIAHESTVERAARCALEAGKAKAALQRVRDALDGESSDVRDRVLAAIEGAAA